MDLEMGDPVQSFTHLKDDAWCLPFDPLDPLTSSLHVLHAEGYRSSWPLPMSCHVPWLLIGFGQLDALARNEREKEAGSQSVFPWPPPCSANMGWCVP